MGPTLKTSQQVNAKKKKDGQTTKRKERKSENKHKNRAERKSQTIQTNLKNVP